MKVLSKIHTELERMGYIEDIVEEGFQWTKEVEKVRVKLKVASEGMVKKGHFFHSIPVTIFIADDKGQEVEFNFDNLDTALKISSAVFRSFESFKNPMIS